MRHPAKFPETVIAEFVDLLTPMARGRILDPFAGTGRVHLLGLAQDDAHAWETVGVELEPEWAELHPRTIVGDACHLPFAEHTFDAIVTSPCYGNRMADQTLDSGGWTRNTYRMALGRPASEGSATSLQWGARYREFHALAWAEVTRTARPGATFLLNVKDHVRNKAPAPVSAFHLESLARCGWSWIGGHRIEAKGYREGENADNRFEFEWVHELRLETF